MYASGPTWRAKISRIVDFSTTIKNIFRHGKGFDDEPGTYHNQLESGKKIKYMFEIFQIDFKKNFPAGHRAVSNLP